MNKVEQSISQRPAIGSNTAKGLRSVAVLVLLVVAFASSLLFYGLGYNHLLLLLPSACAVLALTLLGPERALQLCSNRPFAVGLALLVLVGLTIQQLFFSISPETSFSPSWILAAGPLWFLITLMLVETQVNAIDDTARAPVGTATCRVPWLTPFIVLAGVVALLVVVSAVRFIGFGTRPHDPLVDPSNFGSLVYLVLVPTVHWWLTVPAETSRSSTRLLGSGLLLSMVLLSCCVIFATASRAALGLLTLAVLIWLVLGMLKRVRLRRAVVVAVLACCAYLLANMGSSALQSNMTQDLESDSSIQQRLLLIEAGTTLARQNAPWGGGVFTFSLQYPQVRSTADQSSAGRYVHNDYLQLAAEGGLWLILPVALIILAVGIGNFRMLLSSQSATTAPDAYRHAGGWLALAMVLVHASVNFMFYTLALTMLFGVVAAFAISGRAVVRATVLPGKGRTLITRSSWLLLLGFAWVNLLYLSIDNTNLAVISGQSGLPGVAEFRQSVAGQQRYAALSHRLNADRSLPQLVAAIHARQQASQQPSRLHFDAARAQFESAIATNPWNPSGYHEYLELLQTQGPRWLGQVQADRATDQLLSQALSHVPLDLALAQRQALRLDASQGPVATLHWLMEQVFPWLRHHWTRSPTQVMAVFEDLGRRSLAQQDQQAFAKIRDARQALLELEPASNAAPVWFMRWQQRRAAKEPAAP